MRPDRHNVIHGMNRDIWDEDILSEDFMFIVEKVLTKKERIVAEMKVEGYSNQDISRLMKCSIRTVYNRINAIKKKFANMCSTRINTLGWGKKEDEDDNESNDGVE